jgi:outer membrane protein assembly factor BamB
MTGMVRGVMVWLAAWCLYCSPGMAADWPTEGGGNARLSSSAERLALPLKLQWTYQAPAAPQLAWSSAEGRTIEGKLIGSRIRFDDAFRTVIVNGRVYFGSTVDHQLHCRDLASGKQLWTFYTGGPIRLAPTVAGGRVYFGSDDGRVYCVDAQSGDPVWQRQAAPRDEWLLARGELISKWPIRTGVLLHNGVAYFGAGIFPHEDVYLTGVDPATGRLVWQQDHISALDGGRNDLSPQGYLLAKDDLLVVPSGGSLPAVFDLSTGKMLHKRTHSWRTTAGGVVGGSRALLADDQIYTSGEHHLLAMAERTGDVGFGWFDGRQMAILGDAAYVATGDKVARLNRQEYAVASRRLHALELAIPNLSKDARAKTGAEADEAREKLQAAVEEQKQLANVGVVWQVETPDDRALLATDNAVIVGGPGRVTAYSAADGQVLWTQSVEGDARGLSVADGRLLVSTDTGAIYTFGPQSPAGDPGVAVTDLQPEQFPVDADSELYRTAATQILEQTGVKAGYCLVVGSEEGRLAYELARRSDLKIYCVEPDAEKAERSRRRLTAAGLYGHRVVVHRQELGDLPYSNYFADLIVSDTVLKTGATTITVKSVERHLKPLGGVLCLGRPAAAGSLSADVVGSWTKSSELGDQLTFRAAGGWATFTRGALPGAGNWSHQYGNPGNTAVANDQRIQGDLGVLWYGDPGPGEMVNRHEGAVGPLSVDGRLFVQGESTIKAYDAYNGRHLWTHENPKAVRTGVFQNQNPGNLAAGDTSLFHFLGDKCYQVNMATGAVEAVHELPPDKRDGRYEWGYVAVQGGRLFGTATMRKELEAQLRRRGRVTADATDGLFAIDIANGKHLWSYQGKSISHHTIAHGPDRVFFIDSSITSEQREELLRRDKSDLEKLTGEEQRIAEERAKAADVRLTVALDAKTGEKLWEQAVDVTDCSDIGIGGGKLSMLYANDTLILCGANANGHYWKQFVAGEFQRRRLVALSAYDGFKLWAKDANYRNRPIIIGEQVLAEPWMYNLSTGEQQTRKHPITGADVPWSVMRTGHHCGMLTGCDSGMILFRSGFTGFLDLNADEGIRHFAGHRLGCWINAIVANGLVMIPEASAGCVCQFSIASTIVMEPREIRRPWTIYSAVGAQTPVKHLAVNLGAPGDRKDALGTIWFSYPRHLAYQETSLDVKLKLDPQFADGGGFESVSEPDDAVRTDSPWLYTSWAEGLQKLTLPLLGENDAPANYTIRLHLADVRRQPHDVTTLGVTLNGERAVESLTLAAPADGVWQPVVREIPHVRVTKDLVIELDATQGRGVLNAVEAIRE